jgi:hypothetical protein
MATKELAREPRNREVIRIHVHGGLVQEIRNVPLGVTVRVIDTDGEDAGEDHSKRLNATDREFTGHKTGNVQDEDGGDFLKGTDRATLCDQLRILRDTARDILNSYNEEGPDVFADALRELRFAVEEAERKVPHLTGKLPGDRKQITAASLQRACDESSRQINGAHKRAGALAIRYQSTRLAVIRVPKRLQEGFAERADVALFGNDLKSGIDVPRDSIISLINDAKEVGESAIAEFLTRAGEQADASADGFLFVQ